MTPTCVKDGSGKTPRNANAFCRGGVLIVALLLVLCGCLELCGCDNPAAGSSPVAIGNRTFNSESAEVGTDTAAGQVFVATQKYSVPCTLIRSSTPKPAADGTPSQSVIVYEHDEDGRMTSADWGGSVTLYQYDDEGRLIREEVFSSADSGSADATIVSTVTYSYDADGRLISKESWHETHSETITYEYDEDGRLIRETNSNSSVVGAGSGERTYSYDSDGVLISSYSEATSVSRGGNTWRATTVWYDERGNEVVQTSVDERGTERETRWKYIYDDDGNMVSKTEKYFQVRGSSSGGTIGLQTYYDYDKFGNLLRAETEYENRWETETYAYDCWGS